MLFMIMHGPQKNMICLMKLSGIIKHREPMVDMELDLLQLQVLQLTVKRFTQAFSIQIPIKSGMVAAVTGGLQTLSHGGLRPSPLQLSVTNIAMNKMAAQTS